jgi:hypothetical protein
MIDKILNKCGYLTKNSFDWTAKTKTIKLQNRFITPSVLLALCEDEFTHKKIAIKKDKALPSRRNILK